MLPASHRRPDSMDKPIIPAGPNAPNSQWPEESSSDQDFGATGVFGVVKAPEPVPPPPLVAPTAPVCVENPAPEAAKPQPAPGLKPLAEPVVHRVVFGGGAAESSPELLNRMRMASAERASVAEKAPAPGVGGTGAAPGGRPPGGRSGQRGIYRTAANTGERNALAGSGRY